MHWNECEANDCLLDVQSRIYLEGMHFGLADTANPVDICEQKYESCLTRHHNYAFSSSVVIQGKLAVSMLSPALPVIPFISRLNDLGYGRSWRTKVRRFVAYKANSVSMRFGNKDLTSVPHGCIVALVEAGGQ
jgi:hypothetical protein